MIRGTRGALLFCVALFAVAMIATASSSATTSARPSWCGPKKISLGFTDGFGGNSWRLVTTASARDEAKKCSSVSSISYADGQGNTQKAISDIQGMVAKGVDALALRIREMATEHNVPIVENPPLARSLYASVEVDAEIPVEHYKAVAQIIGFIMRQRSRS